MVITWDSENTKQYIEHCSICIYHLFYVSNDEKRLFFTFTISSVEGGGTGVVDGVRLPRVCLRKGVSKLKR